MSTPIGMKLMDAPPGIGKESWNDWQDRLQRLPPNPSVEVVEFLTGLVKSMHGKLCILEGTATWERAARACIDLYWNWLDGLHKTRLPEMACQRSGVCCAQQHPRVSLFEIKPIANQVLHRLSPAEKTAVARNLKTAAEAEYQDPILGVGVSCPMLIKDEEGRHKCAVHEYRPLVCRLSGVSKPLGWNCAVWNVYGGRRFPTLHPSIVAPLLDLFSYARNHFADAILQVPNRQQMMLIGVGVLAIAGMRPPVKHEEVVTAMGHTDRWDFNLYMGMVPPPVKEEE